MTIVDKNNLITRKSEQRHEISADRDNPDLKMEVWVRDITFFDVQKAAQSMFSMDGDDVSLNLEGYWRYGRTKANQRLCRPTDSSVAT